MNARPWVPLYLIRALVSAFSISATNASPKLRSWKKPEEKKNTQYALKHLSDISSELLLFPLALCIIGALIYELKN